MALNFNQNNEIHPSPLGYRDVFDKFEEIPSRGSYDNTFTRVGLADIQPENIMY